MKKLLFVLALGGSIAAAPAPTFVSQNFMNARSIILTAGAVGVTNGFYNGIVFTNRQGVQLTQTNNINVNTSTGSIVDTNVAYVNLCQDATFWARADGSPIVSFQNTNGLAAPWIGPVGDCNISVTLVGSAAGAGSAVTFRFAPVWDGTNVTTTATEYLSFAVTANGTTAVTFATNCPMHKWVGAKYLRLLDASNADADTGVVLKACQLNGFVP